MGEVTADVVRQAMENADPVLVALSILLREVSTDAVMTLAGMLAMTGHDPSKLPGEFLVQSVLVESEKIFKHIDRESWIQIYDSYHEVKAVVDANPDLRDNIEDYAKKTKQHMRDVVLGLPDDTAVASDPLLDGQF